LSAMQILIGIQHG